MLINMSYEESQLKNLVVRVVMRQIHAIISCIWRYEKEKFSMLNWLLSIS